MLTVYRVKLYLNELQKNDAVGWKQLQMLWTKDMLVTSLLGFLFAVQHWILNMVYVDVALLVACFVGYVVLWKRRAASFPDKFTWWRKWCVWVIAPYDIVVFSMAALLFVWLIC